MGGGIPRRHRDGSLKIGDGCLQLPRAPQGIGTIEQHTGVVGAKASAAV